MNVKKTILSYRNFNKLKFRPHLTLRDKIRDCDRHDPRYEPSTFTKRCCPKGDSARAKRVPIWLFSILILSSIVLAPIPAHAIDEWNAYFNEPNDPPSGDNLAQTLINRINATPENSTIDITFYNLDKQPVVDALKNAAEKRGITVRVIAENSSRYGSNQSYFDDLNNTSGIEVRDDRTDGSPLMHNKFGIFDSSWVWTGSYNTTPTGDSWRNNAIEIDNSTLASGYKEEFDKMWGGDYSTKYPPVSGNFALNGGSSDDLYIMSALTESHYNESANKAICDAIATADYNIYFSIYSFTSDYIREALEDALCGVDNVHGLFSANRLYEGTYDDLLDAGCDVTAIGGDGQAYIHHRYMIIDYGYPDSDPILITGSMNFTKSGWNKNDENTLLLYDNGVVNAYKTAWDADLPEPGTLLLFGSGLLGLAGLIRRKIRK